MVIETTKSGSTLMSIETPEISKTVPSTITLQNIGTYNSITKSDPSRVTPDFSFFNKTYEICILRGKFDVDGTFIHNKNYYNYKYYTGTTYYFISCSKNTTYPCYMVMELSFDPETIRETITTSLPTVYTAVTPPVAKQQVRYIRDYLSGSNQNSGCHWVEIEAYQNGVNIALNKTATSPYAVNNLSAITDGNTSSNNYASFDDGGSLIYVEVDLGAIYDIDQVIVWHYYDGGDGGRTYFNTRTQVSMDGIIWADIFNSATEGTYLEPTNGSGKTTDIPKDVYYFPSTAARTVDYYLNYDYTGVLTESRYPALILPQTRYVRDFLNGSSVSTGNHWVEIEAYQNGINIALNKTTTSPNNITNIQTITDGNTDSTQYTGGDNGPVNVTVDLGALYDIDVVKVYHYYLDGRTFNGTRTQISSNGTNWTDIFNSATSGTYPETQYGKTSGVSKSASNYGYKLQYGFGLILGAIGTSWTVVNNAYNSDFGYLKVSQTTQSTHSAIDYMELSSNSATFVVYDTLSSTGVYFENIPSRPSKTGHMLTYNDSTNELIASKGGLNISGNNISFSGFLNKTNETFVDLSAGSSTVILGQHRNNQIMVPTGWSPFVAQSYYINRISITASGSASGSSDENLTLNEDVNWTIFQTQSVAGQSARIYYGSIPHTLLTPGKYLLDYLGESGIVLKNYKIPGTDITVNGVTRPDGYIAMERPDESGSNWVDSTIEFDYPRTRFVSGFKTEGQPFQCNFNLLEKQLGDTSWRVSGTVSTNSSTGFIGWNDQTQNTMIGFGIRSSGSGLANSGLKWYMTTS